MDGCINAVLLVWFSAPAELICLLVHIGPLSSLCWWSPLLWSGVHSLFTHALTKKRFSQSNIIKAFSAKSTEHLYALVGLVGGTLIRHGFHTCMWNKSDCHYVPTVSFWTKLGIFARSMSNGTCTCYMYAMVSEIQWKPFWLSTDWLDWVAISCELWCILTGPIAPWLSISEGRLFFSFTSKV